MRGTDSTPRLTFPRTIARVSAHGRAVVRHDGNGAACFPLRVHAVDIERSGRVVVVRGSGELDAFAVTDLDAAFAEVGDERRIVADLERVSFMDSTALGVLVRRVRELLEAGAGVRVVLPRGTARRIFEITALDGALPIAADRTTALDELDSV